MKKRNRKAVIIVVPDHQELARGTLKSIMRKANLTSEELAKPLQED